ncbi:hypothetical protein M9H77_20979 [Catharanthus roseus]|uniref:Uncharacterized protein n=1 Tax=Catharanthus roseus TaxID=4058 RepID=A0ACC0AM25_CATRO|nr:hypothetical protein M9H77_20979 [Catharanthus roseus]
MRQIARAQMVPEACDTRLDMHRIQLRGNDHIYWGTQHVIHLDAWYQWRLRVRDALLRRCHTPVMSTSDGIRVSHGFTSAILLTVIPVRMDISLPEVDDMAPVVIQEPPSFPSQMALFAKKGTLGCTTSQHDIQQTFPVQPSRRRPREHVPDRGDRGVKTGARRHPTRGAGDGRPPVPPAPERHEHVDPGHAVIERGEGSGSGQSFGDPFDSLNLYMPSFSLDLTLTSQSLPSGSGTSQMPPAPGLGFASFQSPYSGVFRV